MKKATKMLKLSNNKFSPASVGDTVRFLVLVNRSKCAPRNVLGVVMNVDAEKYLYRIGTSHGVLKNLFTRGDFDVCKESFIHTDDVPEGVKSVREAHGKTAISAGGGFEKCMCKTGCNTNRCKCLKVGKQCHSKCPGSLLCTIK